MKENIVYCVISAYKLSGINNLSNTINGNVVTKMFELTLNNTLLHHQKI